MSAAQSFTSQSLLASHKAAAARATAWLRDNQAINLKPTQALELLARVYGLANWQTLHGLATQGEGPRLAEAVNQGVATSVPEDLRREFEAAFATKHAPTNKRNFGWRGDRYEQDRIQALFEGFAKGRGLSSQPMAPTSASVGKPLAQLPNQSMQLDARVRSFEDVLGPAPTKAPDGAAKQVPVVLHNLKVGQTVSVENGRTEMIYRGTVAAIDGARVTVNLPAANTRPFIFDLADEFVTVQDDIIFTAW